MKTTILLLCFLLASFLIMAQKTPPTAIAQAFAQRFKNIEKVKWNIEEANEWEAEFKINGKELSSSFDLSGKWLETETKIDKKELPQAIKTALNKQFADYKIGESESIESPSFTGYEIALKKKGQEIELRATIDGKLTIKKQFKEKKD